MIEAEKRHSERVTGMKRIYTVLLVLVLLLVPVLPVAAADAAVTDTFTHWTLYMR